MRLSVTDCDGVRLSKLKAPVPLGVVSSAVIVAGVAASDGSIAMLTLARPEGRAASGADRVSLTVDGSTMATSVTLARALRATAAVFSSRMASSENFTSVASKSLPSVNFTPLRRVSVRLLPSAEGSHFSARPGTVARSLS